ncbi:MAG: hypothetical protein FJ109_12680 [Deltaproteobacteria bacterium]|nr:hypothetical protein [Deltaproteobacteria bacterium]
MILSPTQTKGCSSAALVTSALVTISVACGGSSGTGEAMPGDAFADTDATDATSCPPGLVPWPGGGCAPRVDECPNPWELPVLSTAEGPLIGGGCVAIGPRACPKLWDPEADVDCEPGKLMEYDGNACPEGFVLTDDEVACIPFFAEDGVCGENEIPVLGGGCQAVGPRACPKTWDPEADVDCEAGEFVEYDGNACPEGFVLTEDEAACIPFFAEDGACGENEIPVLGGGCQRVGPRACPKLWDPEADVECEVGDVVPCPEGWSESEDGMYCDPKYGECGPGERSLVGGGCERVVPLAEDCPPGPFPAVPEGAADVVYVDAASTCTEACGTQEEPFPTIAAALAVVPEGGYVLVGEGEYAEGLIISKPAHVLGLCSGQVAVTGAVSVGNQNESAVETAGIVVTDTSTVELAGLRLASPAAGIAVVGATGIKIHDVEVSGSAGTGMYAGPGAEVEVDRMWLHDTVPGPKGWLLFGVFAGGGAKVEVRWSLVDSAIGAGAYARDAGTELVVRDSTIRNGQSTAGGAAGFGARATKKADLRIADTLLDNNRDAGILAEGQSLIHVERSAIRGTQAAASGDRGWGVAAFESSTVVASGCVLDENVEAAVIARGAGTQVMMPQAVAEHTKPNAAGMFGYGVELNEAATVVVRGGLLDGNTTAAVRAAGSQTFLELSGTVVRGTKQKADAQYGHGMDLLAGASAVISGCLVSGNGELGICCDGGGTTVEISGSEVTGTRPNPEGFLGLGLQAAAGAVVTLSDSLLAGNTTEGCCTFDPGTALHVRSSVVRGTLPSTAEADGFGASAATGSSLQFETSLIVANAAQGIYATDTGTVLAAQATAVLGSDAVESDSAYGLDVRQGASAEASQCYFGSNRGIGVNSADAGSTTVVSDSIIRGTRPLTSGIGGLGLQADFGAFLNVAGSLVDGNQGAGLSIWGAGTHAEMSSSLVRLTVSDSDGYTGFGVQCGEGASVEMSGSLLDKNSNAGVAVLQGGTEVAMSSCAVRGTIPAMVPASGHGVEVFSGSQLGLRQCLVDDNTDSGMVVAHPGTMVEITECVIRNTRPADSGEGGQGAAAFAGAAVASRGCLIDGNTALGVAAKDPDTSVDLAATIVRDTHPLEDGSQGFSGIVQEGASLRIAGSLVTGSVTAGVAAFAGGRALLDGSAVTDTETGGAGTDVEFEVFGDGLVAAGGSSVEIVSTIVAGNARNGIYYNQSSGSVTDSVIVNNDFYGLAMEECADKVEWEGKGNYIVGNASALPADKAAQVTTSTGGMAVPPAPEMMEVKSGDDR